MLTTDLDLSNKTALRVFKRSEPKCMKGLSPIRRFYVCVTIILLAVVNAFADQQTPMPGQQIMVACRTNKPVVLDGVLGPAEWSAAIPVHVNAVKPGTAPGVIPHVPEFPYVVRPDNPDDLSFTIRAMYDNNNLYVAVEVADDVLIASNPDAIL